MKFSYLALSVIAIYCVACKSNPDIPEVPAVVPEVDLAHIPAKSTNKIYPVPIGEKYGYIDVTGTLVIAPKWDFAEEFREGLALVTDDWGNHENPGMIVSFIDTSGKIVINNILVDDIGQQGFSEGLAPFMENGKVGFIDASGKVAIPAKFWCEPGEGDCGCACEDGAVGAFRNGVTWAKLGHIEILIDRTGKELARGENARFAANRHIEGLTPLKHKKLYGYKNAAGSIVIPAKFSFAGEFSEGIASVTPLGVSEREFVYIDKAGRQICDQIFDLTYDFSEGLAIASIADDYVIVTKQGEIVKLPYKTFAKYPNKFEYGLLMATISEGDGSRDVFIDRDGKVVAEFEFSNSYAFRDRIATPFDGHLAEIYCQDESSVRWVDRFGKTVWSSKPTANN